jgi:hypothetical protein
MSLRRLDFIAALGGAAARSTLTAIYKGPHLERRPHITLLKAALPRVPAMSNTLTAVHAVRIALAELPAGLVQCRL